ncbi:MAG: DNA gyrase/topoisomerase IV subunit A, partial [Duncaniella sp.]|nr:DNA gyrase/topoisomerase IV subunit A [Duncaniella sp.]
TTFDASNHFPEDILKIEKFEPHKVWTAILNDADQGYPYLKRFTFEPSARPQRYLGDNEKSELLYLSDVEGARISLAFGGADSFRPEMEVTAREFVAVKSFRAKGKRLTTWALERITDLEPLPDSNPADAGEEEEEEHASEPEAPEPEKSDEELRDEILGQNRLF